MVSVTRRVLAIVLNWHDIPNTTKCLESLLADPLINEIIVVDNESDGSLESALPEQWGAVHVIAVPENRGFAGGMNAALCRPEVHSADAVLVINNDAVLGVGALSAMMHALEADPNIGLVGPRLVNADGSTQAIGSRLDKLTGLARANVREGQRLDYITWACVLIRPAVLKTIGALDERYFMYWEDVDFSRRAKRAGYKMCIVPTASVAHALSASGDRAGVLLREYYVWSMREFQKKWGGVEYVRIALGFAMLLGKRMLARDVAGCGAALRGWRRRATRSQAWRVVEG